MHLLLQCGVYLLLYCHGNEENKESPQMAICVCCIQNTVCLLDGVMVELSVYWTADLCDLGTDTSFEESTQNVDYNLPSSE